MITFKLRKPQIKMFPFYFILFEFIAIFMSLSQVQKYKLSLFTSNVYLSFLKNCGQTINEQAGTFLFIYFFKEFLIYKYKKKESFISDTVKL